MQWWCKKCNAPRAAVLEGGKIKVRRFRSGFVGVFLECGHTAAVERDKIRSGNNSSTLNGNDELRQQ